MQRAIHTLIGKRTAFSLANCEFGAVGVIYLSLPQPGRVQLPVVILSVSSLCGLFDLSVSVSAESHPHINWEKNSGQPGNL